ncbi:MAG: MFS transporter [Dehalococcoidia bacterium]
MSVSSRMPAFAYRDFRFLWAGTAASSISLWTLLLANAYIVHKISGSSFWVGVATFASMSPYLIAPLGGMVADRYERRYLVRVTRLASFAVTVVLAILAATDVLTVGLVVGLAFAQGLVRSIEIPSDQSLLANVVPASARANGIMLHTTTLQGSRAAGPLLAAPLLGTTGVEGAYAISALFALISFASMSQVLTSSRGGVEHLGQVWTNLKTGAAYIAGNRAVFSLIALVFLHCALTMSYDAMLPGFAETRLHEPGSGFTVINAGVGIGALVGTFILSFMTGVRRGPIYFICGVVSGVGPLLMATTVNLANAVECAILMGSSQAMFMALTGVFLQEIVPDDIRGRVMSLNLMSAGGIMAVANLGFGSLADHTGVPVLLAIPGLVFLAVIVASLGTGPYLRRVYRTGTAMTPATA